MNEKRGFWVREALDGETEFRPIAKMLLWALLIFMALALYFFLTVLGQTEEGLEVIVILAYGVGILMVAATFLVIIISLIEYLRSLE